MDRHYSNKELVRFDETARAPERNYDATAGLAPQASTTFTNREAELISFAGYT